jgi:DNA-directed RNA polymerase specialized sigma subunit
MTAAEYLERVRTVNMEIRAKQRELTGIKIDAQNLRSPVLGEKVISSHSNAVNKAVDRAIDLDAKITEELAQLINIKAEIHANINGLSNSVYITILTEYYINCLTLEEVGECTNYSTSQVKRLRKKAVKAFADHYGFVKDEPK